MKKIMMMLILMLALMLFITGCSTEAKESDGQYEYVQQGYGGGCGVAGQQPTDDSNQFTNDLALVNKDYSF